jgi:hypothetical protein
MNFKSTSYDKRVVISHSKYAILYYDITAYSYYDIYSGSCNVFSKRVNNQNQINMSKNHYEMTQSATAQIEIDFLRDEVKRLKEKLNDVATARALLRSKGYFTENLWCVDDVTQNYKCSNDVAYDVLDKAMSNDATMEQIFLAIDDVCDDLEIRKIKD